MENDKNLLTLSHVSKTYRADSYEVKAINDLSLEINKGEFISIMGPSGCGKSTLMHLLGCLDIPSSGRILFEQLNISSLSEKELAKIRNKKIGFIFQTFNLLPKTTALANVELPLIYTGIPANQRKERAKKVLMTVGLENRLSHFPNQLSGGQQQRVAIARALINNPGLILADEPTGNLDSKSGQEILDLLSKLNKEGRTIVLVTHDKEIAKYAQRIIQMRDGKIV